MWVCWLDSTWAGMWVGMWVLNVECGLWTHVLEYGAHGLEYGAHGLEYGAHGLECGATSGVGMQEW